MSASDLIFTTPFGADITDPYEIPEGNVFTDIVWTLPYVRTTTLRVTNAGTTSLSSLGIYLKSPTNLGSLVDTGSVTPIHAWQTLLTLGQTANREIYINGNSIESNAEGVWFQIGSSDITFLRWNAGDGPNTKIPLGVELSPGNYVDIKIGWSNDIGAVELYFIDLVIE